MDRGNVFDDQSDSEDEEQAMAALPDSDVDEMENVLKSMTTNDGSEEYSDDDVVYPPRVFSERQTSFCNENCESEEFSEDDVTYPDRSPTPLSNAQQDSYDDWVSVAAGNDQRTNILPDFNEKLGPTFPANRFSLPATFYNEMLPDSLFDHIVVCTNSRARAYFDALLSPPKSQETRNPVGRDEMKKFVVIVVHMGTIRKRSIREYWSTDPFLVIPICHSQQYLSRNRFMSILRFLRFADCENLVANDRSQRIRPFLDRVRQLCQSKYIPSRQIAGDETLMLYKGRLLFKQYNPRTRARFGIKTFALCDSSNGYLINFEVYTGSDVTFLA